MPNSSSEIGEGRGFVIAERVRHPRHFACHDGLVAFAPCLQTFPFHVSCCPTALTSSPLTWEHRSLVRLSK